MLIIISLFDLHGCETWFAISREGRRLRLLENRVPRKICGPKVAEVTVNWAKLLV